MAASLPPASGLWPELMQQVQATLPATLRDFVAVVPWFRQLTEAWHAQETAPDDTVPPLHRLAMSLHLCNFRLWHAEDRARRPGASDGFVAETKRTIDRLNQQRHAHIEQLDALLFAFLYEEAKIAAPTAELHSETPASLLDRLSILTLKVYHMAREAERADAPVAHRQVCRQRLGILEEQYADLLACLGRLCLELWSGRKRFKVYRQFKMYNDPTLNPEIYRFQRYRGDT